METTRNSCRAAADDPRGQPDKGFALIPVLMAIALLSLVALVMSQSARDDLRMAAAGLRQAEAASLADGMTRLAIRHLVDARRAIGSDRKVKTDGSALACSVAGHIASISIFDAAGLVDLNKGSLETLEAMFTGLDVDPAGARHLAAAIVDFRDPDDIALPDGAEAAEYAAAGLQHGPKNAPFGSVDELDQVLGMTPDLLARVRPLVTVHSQNSSVDLDQASEAVRALGLPSTPGAKLKGNNFIVRASIAGLGSARFVREAVVGVSPQIAGGHIVKQWTEVTTGLDPAGIDAGELPSCLDALL